MAGPIDSGRFTAGDGFGGKDAGTASVASGTGKTTAAVPGMDDALNPKKKKREIDQDESVQYSLFSVDKPLFGGRGPEYGYDRIRLRKNEEVSIYAQQEDARHAMDPRKKGCFALIGVMVLAFFVIILLPDVVYTEQHVNNSFARWLEDLMANVNYLTAALTLQTYSGTMVFKICQYLVVALAGAGLAVTGAMFQGALKNAMASPTTLGVTSGAQMGSVLYILLGGSTVAASFSGNMSDWTSQMERLGFFEYFWLMNAQAICSLAGALIVVLLVLAIAHIAGRGKVSKSGLIIAGSVFTTVITGVVQLVRYWLTVNGDSEQQEMVTSIATGTIGQTWTPIQVVIVAIPVLICLAALMMMRSKMNLLAFSDDEAKSMGLSPEASRNVTVAICTLLTAVIVAFCGAIGFVGFMIPHITRKVVGPDFRYLVPGSMLVGAIFAMVTNCFTNSFLSGLGMGSFTGIIGSVVFLITVLRQRGRGNADWV